MKLKKILDEITISNQEVGNYTGNYNVAPTTTRFRGTTYEPLYFDPENPRSGEGKKKRDFRELDIEFWKDALPSNWVYANPEQIEDYEKAVDDIPLDVDLGRKGEKSSETVKTDKQKQKEIKKEIEDGDFQRRYRNLLRRLRKFHNI